MKGFFKIKLKEFKQLNIFFNDLELDNNDIKLYGKTPFRKRKILYAQFNNDKLIVLKKTSFSQNVKDERRKKRKFDVLRCNESNLALLEKFLKTLIDKSRKKLPHIPSSFEVTFHFVQILASKSGESNSPEGIHRDGFDLLFPCVVIERCNIIGGLSRVYNKKNDNFVLIFNKTIQEGEALVIDEKNYPYLYHDVTPIILKNKNKIGYRNIIGVDINF
jgi:hypothetical protein